MTKGIRTAAAVTMFGMGSLAFAAQPETGPYIGASLGMADISRDVTEDYTYKTDKFTWAAIVGWQLHPNFAVEASYLKPKNISETVTDGGDTATVTGKFHGLTVTGLLTWPLSERWSAHARLGAVRAREKYTATLNGDPAASFADSTTEVLYGAGVGLLVDGARMRLDYQRAKFDYGSVGIVAISINWFLPTSR